MEQHEIRAVAKKRLEARANFKHYLLVWAAVSLLVTVIWAVTSPGAFFWPLFPILGMGVGALFMGIDAYGSGRGIITDQDIDAEVQRMTKGSGASGR